MSDRDRKAPPAPSAYVLSEDPDEAGRRDSKPSSRGKARTPEPEEEPNAHLNLDRIEGRMNQSVARQVIKLLRDNPEMTARVVKGWMGRK